MPPGETAKYIFEVPRDINALPGCNYISTTIFNASGDRTMMNYKGYVAVVEYDDDAEVFHGEIANTRDVITFQSDDAKKLKTEMITSIDAHIAFCKKTGKKPSMPYPGEFLVRTTPAKHGRFTAAAKLSGLSLNKWVDKVLEMAAKDIIHA